jgi:hypothetical protein
MEQRHMQKKEFKLHKAALYSIIVAQAGTFEKALLELVMNAVDAGSTRVDVSLTNTAFSVSDDGRGFAGEYEIEHYFGTFGTPHADGDAPYGKFRMGRGQIMAFTRNTWRSNDFKMSVNIKEDGDHYVFEKGLPAHPGCLIEGTMYEPLQTTERLAVERNLAEMVKYVGIVVTVNGEKASKRHLEDRWTFEDEDAYYLLSPSRDRLAIFNLGVLVKETWASDFGMGGIILSKKQLVVNMARNDVLVSQCPVWKRVTKTVRTYVASVNKTEKVTKNENWRQMTARKALAGSFDAEEDAADVLAEKVLTLIDGKHVSLEDLLHLSDPVGTTGRPALNICVAKSDGDVRADKAHKAEFAVVLSPKVLTRFGAYKPLGEVFSGIAQALQAQQFLKAEAALAAYRKRGIRNASMRASQQHNEAFEFWQRTLKTLAQRSVESSFLDGFKDSLASTVHDKDLKAEELAMLNVLRRAQYALLRGLKSPAGNSLSSRQLLAGKNDGAEAWTDGHSRIWIDVRNLKFAAYNFAALIAYATKMATLLVHEYMHSDDDQQTSVHSTEFYEGFEREVCFSDSIGQFAAHVAEAWLHARVKLQKASARKDVLKRTEVKMIKTAAEMGMDVEDPAHGLPLPGDETYPELLAAKS